MPQSPQLDECGILTGTLQLSLSTPPRSAKVRFLGLTFMDWFGFKKDFCDLPSMSNQPLLETASTKNWVRILFFLRVSEVVHWVTRLGKLDIWSRVWVRQGTHSYLHMTNFSVWWELASSLILVAVLHICICPLHELLPLVQPIISREGSYICYLIGKKYGIPEQLCVCANI